MNNRTRLNLSFRGLEDHRTVILAGIQTRAWLPLLAQSKPAASCVPLSGTTQQPVAVGAWYRAIMFNAGTDNADDGRGSQVLRYIRFLAVPALSNQLGRTWNPLSHNLKLARRDWHSVRSATTNVISQAIHREKCHRGSSTSGQIWIVQEQDSTV